MSGFLSSVAAAGFVGSVVGVGAVTRRPVRAAGAAALLLLALSLVYPFARLAAESD